MPDAIFFVICFKRKNPVFAPDKVMYLCHNICAYISYNITLALDVHQQSYYESCNQSIERSYYCKAYNPYRFLHPVTFLSFSLKRY